MAKIRIGDALRFRREANGAFIPDGRGSIEASVVDVHVRPAIEATDGPAEPEFVTVRVIGPEIPVGLSLPIAEALTAIPASAPAMQAQEQSQPSTDAAPANTSPAKGKPGKTPLGS